MRGGDSPLCVNISARPIAGRLFKGLPVWPMRRGLICMRRSKAGGGARRAAEWECRRAPAPPRGCGKVAVRRPRHCVWGRAGVGRRRGRAAASADPACGGGRPAAARPSRLFRKPTVIEVRRGALPPVLRGGFFSAPLPASPRRSPVACQGGGTPGACPLRLLLSVSSPVRKPCGADAARRRTPVPRRRASEELRASLPSPPPLGSAPLGRRAWKRTRGCSTAPAPPPLGSAAPQPRPAGGAASTGIGARAGVEAAVKCPLLPRLLPRLAVRQPFP